MNQMLEDAISVIGGDGLPSPCEASLLRGDPAGFDPKSNFDQGLFRSIAAYFWGLMLTDHPVGKKHKEIRMRYTGANAA